MNKMTQRKLNSKHILSFYRLHDLLCIQEQCPIPKEAPVTGVSFIHARMALMT